MNYSTTEQAIFTVSQLNERAKQLLEISFSNVRVEGEISSLSRPSSGHWYFSLKDNKAQVRCAMFRSNVARLKFQPREGDKIEIRARVSLYEARGDYQLIVESMKPAGEGALLLAFQQLKARLTAEGLFDPQYKQPIPKARRVAVITSASGAALHDILTVLKRRNPAIEVDIYPAMVQGQEAPAQLISALARANRDNQCDAIILGRGGGSLEDLWCFNDEQLARAIFESRLPVVSAVGHEVDFTIADFVADLRAPTPSAAAELISDDQRESLQRLMQLRQRLLRAQSAHTHQLQQRLLHLRQRLRDPARQLEQQSQQLDQLERRLVNAWKQQQQQRQWQLQGWQQRLQHQHPQTTLSGLNDKTARLSERLQRGMQRLLEQRRQQLGYQAGMLQNLSPLNVLGRGYALVQTPDGSVVQNAEQVHSGDMIKTRLASGWLESQVTYSHPASNAKES
ncbi:exodeoxyribonuclease VII large subunit [Oceanobacter mangrovi]|uniref:exodeoxyribonuclease VII large subunit n=1 Tax=Oceanobacter mangrovi TaxID=2862510 RepID=UPI001C8D67E9|nr:exodeoxyribonuclease VII large subunit [Oceanobacter mangrovi]